jgi:hypothetical protein
VEISGPSSSSTAVPSSVFVFNFGLPRSRSDADVDVDVEIAIEVAEVGDGGCSLVEGRRYLLSRRGEGDVNEPSQNKENRIIMIGKKGGMGAHHHIGGV